MKVVIQRVSEAAVKIDGSVNGSIESGLLILVGIENSDTEEDVNWLASKIVSLRIFSDENGLMNLSVKEINGGVLVISQFTLTRQNQKRKSPFIHRCCTTRTGHSTL
jgi:D-tyrosyl-tRNA(Tyr) deacylase